MPIKFLSLHYKFLGLSLILISLATGLYLYLATELFKKDKQAYIYDNNAALVETLAEEVSASLMGSINTARHAVLVWARSNQAPEALETVKAVLQDDDGFVDFAVMRVNADSTSQATNEILRITHENYLQPYNAGVLDLDAARKQASLPLASVLQSDVLFRNIIINDNLILLEMMMPLSMNSAAKPDHVVSALLRQDRRLTMFQRSKMYTTYLTTRRGSILVHSDATLVMKRAPLPNQALVTEIIESKINNGAREYIDATANRHILAYKKLGVGDLYAFSEIPYDKAFLATKDLIDKSIWFAVLVFSLSFAISLLFTRKLTDALRRLYNASIQVAQGDFSVRVAASTRDEVGALTNSFNHMTGEISRLLVETEVKARMEHELRTAQLVQENFFPQKSFVFDGVEIVSYFKPATECGGDWWTVLPVGRKFAVLIGDATGHGVPAALITAAAHSCASTLAKLSLQLPDLLADPALIASYLNHAVCEAGRGKIKMTFFIAIIDPDSGQISYVNAAHETPVVCRNAKQFSADQPAGRDMLDSVTTSPDRCMGEALDAKFRTQTMTLNVGDALVFYTDGLLENTNNAGEEYGESRFLRSYLKHAYKNATELCADVVTDYESFAGNQASKDDMTIVVITRSSSSSALKVAV